MTCDAYPSKRATAVGRVDMPFQAYPERESKKNRCIVVVPLCILLAMMVIYAVNLPGIPVTPDMALHLRLTQPFIVSPRVQVGIWTHSEEWKDEPGPSLASAQRKIEELQKELDAARARGAIQQAELERLQLGSVDGEKTVSDVVVPVGATEIDASVPIPESLWRFASGSSSDSKIPNVSVPVVTHAPTLEARTPDASDSVFIGAPSTSLRDAVSAESSILEGSGQALGEMITESVEGVASLPEPVSADGSVEVGSSGNRITVMSGDKKVVVEFGNGQEDAASSSGDSVPKSPGGEGALGVSVPPENLTRTSPLAPAPPANVAVVPQLEAPQAAAKSISDLPQAAPVQQQGTARPASAAESAGESPVGDRTDASSGTSKVAVGSERVPEQSTDDSKNPDVFANLALRTR